MTRTNRRLQLLRDLAAVRRAELQTPGSRDLAAVRASLEDQLGATVSRRSAAALLGVSHSALGRWIDSGDVPLVYSPVGRWEVPVGALLELHDAVNRVRERGERRRHVLEPALAEGRRRATRLNPWELAPAGAGRIEGHGRADLRSLVYHRAVAERLREPMIAEARRLVARWCDQGKLADAYAARWESLLGRPVTEIARAIGEDSPTGRDLRQSSPFAGALSEAERRKILREIR